MTSRPVPMATFGSRNLRETGSGGSQPPASSPSSAPASAPARCRGHHGRPRRQSVVHGIRRQPDRADHTGRRRHRVQRRHQPRGGPQRHHGRPRWQSVVHGIWRQPDRADHNGRRRHRVQRRHQPGAGPGGIATGPDGNLWFTERNLDRIGRITPAGVVTEFGTGISPDANLRRITAGPDGNLWFTEYSEPPGSDGSPRVPGPPPPSRASRRTPAPRPAARRS